MRDVVCVYVCVCVHVCVAAILVEPTHKHTRTTQHTDILEAFWNAIQTHGVQKREAKKKRQGPPRYFEKNNQFAKHTQHTLGTTKSTTKTALVEQLCLFVFLTLHLKWNSIIDTFTFNNRQVLVLCVCVCGCVCACVCACVFRNTLRSFWRAQKKKRTKNDQGIWYASSTHTHTQRERERETQLLKKTDAQTHTRTHTDLRWV